MSRTADTEGCIRRAAELLLEREGPAFSMDTLARKAGVSRATLYRHLGGRERLAELVASARRGPSARERLVAAAGKLVADRGLHGFTLEEVAGDAGVSPTTLYREFNDRSDLLRAVAESVGPVDEIAALLAEHRAPPRVVLTRFVTAVLRRLQQQPLFLRLVLLGDVARLEELRRLRKTRASVSQALTAYLSAQVRQGRLRPYPIPRLAGALLGSVLGTRVAVRLMPESLEVPFEETAREIVDLYLSGAGAEGTHG